MLQVVPARSRQADASERLKISFPRQEEVEERLDMGESSQRRLSCPPVPAVVSRRASVDTAPSMAASSTDTTSTYAARPKHEAGVDTDSNWLEELWDEDSPGAARKAAASDAKSPQEQNAEDTVQAFLDENWDSDEE
jgi:hypothetical protein